MKYEISINKIQTLWKNFRKSSKIIKSIKRNRKKIKPAMRGIVEILQYFWNIFQERLKG